MQVSILGRQPKLSVSELESLYGSENIRQISTEVAIVRKKDILPQAELGGTIKSGSIITTLKNKNVEKAYEYINKNVKNIASKYVPDGKIQFGISLYGSNLPRKSMFAKNLDIKKILRSANRSVRIIENKSEILETAQVLHNKLATDRGIELLIIKDNKDIIIARTTGVQDIDAYTKRDQNRPLRDAKVGMLPPKLAQIIINLATGKRENLPNDSINILDPFCGTGVLLQEASLLGFNVYGSDLEERMVDYTLTNLKWISRNSKSSLYEMSEDEIMKRLKTGDATTLKWEDCTDLDSTFIACETYLGKPLTSLPSKKILDIIVKECDILHTSFLKNISTQIRPGSRLCIAVPAWITQKGFLHLNTLDHLNDLGYNRMSFVHAKDSDLIYHRPDQTVARELVVLEKK